MRLVVRAALSPSSRRAWIEIVRYTRRNAAALSPSSRRAWIEIGLRQQSRMWRWVALLAEGVDRNNFHVVSLFLRRSVALLAEGVDRNSVSSVTDVVICPVALLAEGVDRNIFLAFLTASAWVALLAEGVDRNNPIPRGL